MDLCLTESFISVTTKGPVREALDSLYAAKKNRPVTTEYSCDIEGLKDGNKRYIYRVDRESNMTMKGLRANDILY